ncbi:MAG TPA: hypothetical protein VKW77_01505, partial [Acidimicrobiales bacterium]|nr:hypothetical protein [Acidimicrobiales bacterium]
MAVLGTVLVTRFRSELTSSLVHRGVPAGRAGKFAASASQGGRGTNASTIPHFVRLDFVHATQTVLFVMAAIMAVAAVVALLGLEAGVQEEVPEAADETAATPAATG